MILTDQDGFFDKDPRVHPEATLIPEARALDDGLLGMAGKEGGTLGRGGMYTKIMAAQQAARSGAMTVIANGRVDGVLEQLRAGDLVGSLLYPDLKPHEVSSFCGQFWREMSKEDKQKYCIYKHKI
mgnify:CR=1 FL=1